MENSEFLEQIQRYTVRIGKREDKELYGSGTLFFISKRKRACVLICTQNPGHIDYCSGSTHGCYPIFNGRHPFCFCLNSFIIVVFYVFFNSY